MNAFDFAAPTSVEDAVKLLDGQNTVALSGGTDLLGRIKDRVTSPQRVVYLKDIKTSSGISGDAGSGDFRGRHVRDVVALDAAIGGWRQREPGWSWWNWRRECDIVKLKTVIAGKL